MKKGLTEVIFILDASRKYSSDAVKRLVEAKKELGWEFVFLAANIDAVETAARFGIDSDRAVEYRNDSYGTGLKFRAMSDVLCCMEAEGSIDDSWKTELENDNINRK